MKKFIGNIFLFIFVGLIPLLVLSVGYLYLDPFKVIRKYSDFSYPYVIPNRDYMSTEIFNQNVSKYHYNSFIFGSSRTLAFRPASWARHLPANSSPYMFDASIETVYGIYTKLRYLDSLHVNIKNVLIVLCQDASFKYESNLEGHLFIKDPKTSGESWLAFQLVFYKAYMNTSFQYSFYRYLVSKKFRPFMRNYIEYRKIAYDTITNEIRVIDQEAELLEDTIGYYKRRKNIFFKQAGETIDTNRQINSSHLFMLTEIKRILEKSRTNYKVVISPLYDQVKFNPGDWATLKHVFGDHLYDFSGSNSFTNNMHNFYESSHYKPVVGDSIMNIIYK